MSTRKKNIERMLKGFAFPNFDNLKSKDNPEFEREFSYAINYANYAYEHSELKEFAQEYFPKHDLSKVPEWEFMHIGIMCWLALRSVPLTLTQTDYMNEKVNKALEKYDKPEEARIHRDLKTIRTNALIAELEGLLDDAVLSKHLTQPLEIIRNAGIVDIQAVHNHFKHQHLEMTNPENAEYFERKDIKKLIAVLSIILSDLGKAQGMKPARKQRVMKPRKINPTKVVKNLKYLKEDKENSLNSIDPERIIGSEILWVYNVKTRKMGKYIAKDGAKLSVKGSTILNFDEALSTMKIVRKPKDILPKILNAGKVEQRKILDTINAVEQKLGGRINKDTILMRVF